MIEWYSWYELLMLTNHFWWEEQWCDDKCVCYITSLEWGSSTLSNTTDSVGVIVSIRRTIRSNAHRIIVSAISITNGPTKMNQQVLLSTKYSSIYAGAIRTQSSSHCLNLHSQLWNDDWREPGWLDCTIFESQSCQYGQSSKEVLPANAIRRRDQSQIPQTNLI